MTTVSELAASLGDRYRIERELGSGGMATVFLATELKHSRPVAIKVLKPELAVALGPERFLREIGIAAHLDHPHILTLIDSGTADGMLYYVLPYVRGESLRQKLAREHHLALNDALRVARQVGAALDYAHRAGIVHRDIKPENILLQEGEAVLTDFGIALAVQDAGGNRLTETGASLGTPEYMSPEQASGDRELDARSDEYSLAAVVYEMLAGEPPHTGASARAVIAKILTERPTSLRVLRDAVPEGVDRAVAKALAKVPADRYPDVAGFVTGLDAGFAAPAHDRRTRGRRAGGAAAVLALGIAAVALWLHRPHPSAQSARPEFDRVQVTTSGHATDPAVSSDGAEVAYLERTCADNGACHRALIVRDLASGAERSLVDDIGWGFPTAFTSDGAWLLVNGVAVAGGRPAGQYVVSRLGGPLVFVGPGRGDFLPSGDSVLIASASDTAATVRFHVIGLPVTQPADTTRAASRGKFGEIDNARVAPNGRWVAVLWERWAGNDIVALYDRQGVLRDTTRVPASTAFSLRWAPTGHAVLAYVTARTGEGSLLRIAVDSSGRFGSRDTLIVTPGQRGASEFATAPAGRGLVYQLVQSGEDLVWTLLQREPGPPRPAKRVRSSSLPLRAVLTKDGRTLVFDATVPGAGVPADEFFAQAFDSGDARPITSPLPGVIAWTPTLDGRRLVVETKATGAGVRLTAYDIATGHAVPFAELEAAGLLSESGRDGIAVLDPASGTLHLFDAAGREHARVTIPDSLGYAYTFTSSPDAMAWAFLAIRPDTESGESAARQAIYRVDAQTKTPHRITWFAFGNEVLDPFAWADDGSIYFGALAALANRPMLWRVPASGGTATVASTLPFEPDRCSCSLSSDGTRWVGAVSHPISDIFLLRDFDLDRR